MAQHHVQGRLATRCNSLLQERPRTSCASTGMPPTIRAAAFLRARGNGMAQHQVKGPLATRFHSMLQERLPMPQPRARPNGAERRAKDLADFAQTGEAQTGEARNPHRTTRLWEEFLPQAGQEEYRSRRHAREADRLNQARRGRSPDLR